MLILTLCKYRSSSQPNFPGDSKGHMVIYAKFIKGNKQHAMAFRN